MLCMAQLFGREFACVRVYQHVCGVIEVSGDLFKRKHVPAPRAECTFSAARSGKLLEMFTQRLKTGFCFDGEP